MGISSQDCLRAMDNLATLNWQIAVGGPPRHQARSNRRELLPKSNPSAYGPCNVCRRAGQQRDTVKSAGEDLNLRHRPQTLTGVTAVLNLHRGLHQKRDGARIARQAFCPVPGSFTGRKAAPVLKGVYGIWTVDALLSSFSNGTPM